MKRIFKSVESDGYTNTTVGYFFQHEDAAKSVEKIGVYGSVEYVDVYESIDEHPKFKELKKLEAIKAKLTPEEIEYLKL